MKGSVDLSSVEDSTDIKIIVDSAGAVNVSAADISTVSRYFPQKSKEKKVKNDVRNSSCSML